MPPKKTIKRKTIEDEEQQPAADPDALANWVRRYEEIRSQEALLADRSDRIKRTLKSQIEEHGYESQGSYFLDITPVTVNKKGKEVTLKRIQNRAHTTEYIDVDKAEKILAKAGVLDRCTSVVLHTDAATAEKILKKYGDDVQEVDRALDQDEISACVSEELITENQYDSMIGKKTVYHFWTLEG